ncbi:MAG TPA: hypothetical protein VMZ91_15760 [Candidatus Paceibacterota bacterium]|nr:hypothetical protein [Candidatus Paceibacterota bacterium]
MFNNNKITKIDNIFLFIFALILTISITNVISINSLIEDYAILALDIPWYYYVLFSITPASIILVVIVLIFIRIKRKNRERKLISYLETNKMRLSSIKKEIKLTIDNIDRLTTQELKLKMRNYQENSNNIIIDEISNKNLTEKIKSLYNSLLVEKDEIDKALKNFALKLRDKGLKVSEYETIILENYNQLNEFQSKIVNLKRDFENIHPTNFTNFEEILFSVKEELGLVLFNLQGIESDEFTDEILERKEKLDEWILQLNQHLLVLDQNFQEKKNLFNKGIQERRNKILRRIIENYQQIKLFDMANLLEFESPKQLEFWLIETENLPIMIDIDNVFFSKKDNMDSEIIEDAINSLMEQFKNWEAIGSE